MKFLSGLFGLILLIIALCFVLSNRQATSVSLWPLDLHVDAPLYLLTLGMLFFGLLLGGFIVWFGMLRQRFETKRMRKEITKLREKIEDMQQTILPPGTALEPVAKLNWRFWNRHP